MSLEIERVTTKVVNLVFPDVIDNPPGKALEINCILDEEYFNLDCGTIDCDNCICNIVNFNALKKMHVPSK